MDLVLALLQIIFGAAAGGVFMALVQYIRARGQNRNEAKAQHDEHLVQLHAALDADEGTFRAALLQTIDQLNKDLSDARKEQREERKERKELDARLTETQNQLTIITAERDSLSKEQAHTQAELDRTQAELEQTKAELAQTRNDLNQAHEKIRHMGAEIAALQAQQKEHG